MKLNRTGNGDLKAHCSLKAESWGGVIPGRPEWTLVEIGERKLNDLGKTKELIL